MSTNHEQYVMGHFVSFYDAEADMTMSFPAITIKGLALELAEMLREVLPAQEVSVVSYRLSEKEAAEAEGTTLRAKRRVIEAREAECPGAAFLDGIGYWPFGAKPTQE